MKQVNYLMLSQQDSEKIKYIQPQYPDQKTLSHTGMSKNLDAEEELFLNPERRHGTLPETITCGLTSCPYLIKNNKYLTLLKSGMHSTTWPYMNYLQSSTTNM